MTRSQTWIIILSHAAEQDTSHSIEEQEEDYGYHQTNKTGVATTPALWDNLPYGCKHTQKLPL